MSTTRRRFIGFAGASAAVAAFGGCASLSTHPPAGRRVVVIGGGYGGASAATRLRQLAPQIEVVLIEREPAFVSCALSNRILAGTMAIDELTVGYGGLAANGVRVVRGEVTAIDADARAVRLAGGSVLRYDRLIVAAGIDFMYETIPSMAADPGQAMQVVPHAWKAGAQTLLLRRQLEAMPDGGVFAIHIPPTPYRCPPAPYERVSQVAWYLRNNKPKSKIVVLDSNDAIVAKAALFTAAWKKWYPGMIDYRPKSLLVDVDLRTLTAITEFEKVRADVLNVLPPMRAGRIAAQAGLVTTNARWCDVNYLTLESVKVKNVHVLGDSTFAAPGMAKSGHMANQHAKVCASAIADLMQDRMPFASPMMINTCYSFITDREAVRVSHVHRYDADKRTMMLIPGGVGLSAEPTALEGTYAVRWAQNIFASMLG
jgi:sulfide dehydrogenase [flavocytochrome c] flavoprotein chain